MTISWKSPRLGLKPIWQRLRADHRKNMHGRVGLDQALPLPHQLPHQHHLTPLVLGNQLHGYRQALRGNQHSQPLPMYQRLNSRSPPSRTTNASTVARKNIQLPISPWQVVQP